MTLTSMARRRHELLQDAAECAASTALEQGATADIADQVGAAVADMLAERWAGQQITFPINAYYGLSPREVMIVEMRNGGAPIFQLAREFGMTERGVRKLLARVEAGRAKISDQMDMFGAEAR